MSGAYGAFYATQWLVFLLRLLLSYAYGVLAFISKPGSRYVVPVLIALAMLWQRAWLHVAVVPVLLGFGPTAYLVGFVNGMTESNMSVIERTRRKAMYAVYGMPVDDWLLDVFLVVAFLLIWLAYYLLSRVLAVVIGTFPRITRPLRPLRRLQATAQNITSAVVVIAVPRLRR